MPLPNDTKILNFHEERDNAKLLEGKGSPSTAGPEKTRGAREIPRRPEQAIERGIRTDEAGSFENSRRPSEERFMRRGR
jgi:hypothetical protein